jgi:DMSO/TMAO reductase YedYZ molybdopterin-dependent catalytic subunit
MSDLLSRFIRNRDNSSKRIPPGQVLTENFPVLHYGSIPNINLSEWDFRVYGLLEEEVVWSWNEFSELPKRMITLDIHCVTRWTKLNTKWEGVSIKELIEKRFIRPKTQAQYVIQHCEHGFTTNLPLNIVTSDNFLLATHYNGKPLTLEHGFPLRGVIGSFPDRSEEKTKYLWKGGKWLRALEFRGDDQLGFWERNGYHNLADPWKEQRYTDA